MQSGIIQEAGRMVPPPELPNHATNQLVKQGGRIHHPPQVPHDVVEIALGAFHFALERDLGLPIQQEGK